MDEPKEGNDESSALIKPDASNSSTQSTTVLATTVIVVPAEKKKAWPRRHPKLVITLASIIMLVTFFAALFEIPNSIANWWLNWRQLFKIEGASAITNTPAMWLPPELPRGCTNVLLSFGGLTMNVPLLVAQIGSTGTKFLVKEVPEQFLRGLDKMTNYSPRNPNMWMKRSAVEYEIGGKKIEFPIAPFVVSNRLFVDVHIPFASQKRVLWMRDDLDSELPRLWDRNYDSNKFEVVNENQRPVLQVIYKAANHVQVNGVFIVNEYDLLETFGGAPLLLSPVVAITDGQVTQEMTVKNFTMTFTNFRAAMDTNAAYDIPFADQRPMFKYPSNRYLGELAAMTNGGFVAP